MVEDDGGPWVLADGRCITHADLRRGAARAASGFAALGVGEGDAVAILLGNGTPFLEAMLGATLVGAHPVPISPAAPPADVAFILADCAARLLVADAALADRVPPGPPRLPVADVAAWERWTSLHPPRAAPAPAFRGSIAYTSGTTGRPKGLRRAPPPPGHRPARALMVYGFDRPGRAVALIDGPLHHSVPNAYARVALGAGADIVLRPGFDPEATLDAIARHRVTHLHLVPSAMARLLALPDAVRRRSDLSSLRHVVHGAAPCPPHVRRGMVEWWGPVLHEYYGSTETGLLTFHTEAEAVAAPGQRRTPAARHRAARLRRGRPPAAAGCGRRRLRGFRHDGGFHLYRSARAPGRDRPRRSRHRGRPRMARRPWRAPPRRPGVRCRAGRRHAGPPERRRGRAGGAARRRRLRRAGRAGAGRRRAGRLRVAPAGRRGRPPKRCWPASRPAWRPRRCRAASRCSTPCRASLRARW